MPITIVADKLDEFSEALQKVAKQDANGKFVVASLPQGFALEDVTALKNAHERVSSERNQFRETVKAFEASGLKPEDAKDAAEALLQMRGGKLKSSTEIDAWRAEVTKKHENELAARDAKLSKREKALRDQLVRGRLAPIIAAKDGTESMEAILTLAERNIQVQEDSEGNLVPVVVAHDGKTPLVTKKIGSVDPMGFEEFIDVMRDAPATRGLFRAKATGGANSASQSGDAGRAGNPGQRKSARDLIAEGHAQSKAAQSKA